MKAKFKVNEISKALKLCFNASDQKDTLRSNILFIAENDSIIMKATNSMYSLCVSCPSEISESGVAFVDGKMAYNVISKASGECTITSDERSMTIKASGRTKLPNINRDLPFIEEASGNIAYFDSVAFKNAIEKTEYAISEDQSRIILTGAHIVTDGLNATVTCLDGFRLSQTTFPCHGDSIDIIVPSKILSAICDAITDGELQIATNGARITVIGNNFGMNAVLLDGNYIDTSRIIPTEFKTNVLTKTQSLKECLETASIASDVGNMVKLEIGNDKISITSKSEKADFDGDLDAVIDGNDLSIAFNLKYIIHALSHITTEQCEIHASSSISPVVFKPHGNESEEINLVLPVRTF